MKRAPDPKTNRLRRALKVLLTSPWLTALWIAPGVLTLEAPLAQATSSAAVEESAPDTTGMEDIQRAAGDQSCGQECLLKRANENLLLQSAYTILKYRRLEELPDNAARARELGAYCGTGEASSACYDRYVREARRILPELRGSASRNLDTIETLRGQGTQSMTRSAPPSGTPAAVLPYLPSFDQMRTQYQRNGATEGRALEENLAAIGRAPRLTDFPKMKEEEIDGRKRRFPERGANGQVVYDQERFEAALRTWERTQRDRAQADQQRTLEAATREAKTPRPRRELNDRISTTDREAFLEARDLVFEAVEKTPESSGAGASGRGAGVTSRTPGSTRASPSPNRGRGGEATGVETDGSRFASPVPTPPRRRSPNEVLRPPAGRDPNEYIHVEYPLDPVDRFIDGMNAEPAP